MRIQALNRGGRLELINDKHWVGVQMETIMPSCDVPSSEEGQEDEETPPVLLGSPWAVLADRGHLKHKNCQRIESLGIGTRSIGKKMCRRAPSCRA